MASYAELKAGDIRVLVAPAQGGVIAQIYLGEIEIMKLDPKVLDIAPMSAGGVPVLFPFPGKTADDMYMIEKKAYTMPVHGLVKNASFAVREKTENKIVLWRDSCNAEKRANYPFDYELELEYWIEKESVFMEAHIKNKGDQPLPHCLGWHPYFKATDKKALKFSYFMTRRYNYVTCMDEAAPEIIDLSLRWDDVFHSSRKNKFSMENPVDGYQVICIPDQAHQVLVICSWIEGAICLEPWCGIPNSINNGRFVQSVLAGETQVCRVEWQLRRI